MIKNTMKKLLENFFEFNIKKGQYPSVNNDYYEEEKFLFINENKEKNEYRWIYKEKEKISDFKEKERELKIEVNSQIKDYYNSFYFIEYKGFFHKRAIWLDGIIDSEIPAEEKIGENYYFLIGLENELDLPILVELNSAQVIIYDEEKDEIEILENTLNNFLMEIKQPTEY